MLQANPARDMCKMCLPLLTLLLVISACTAEPTQARKDTILRLSATEATTVENDQMVVDFRIEAEGLVTGQLQEAVNVTSREVQALLAKYPEIKVQTTGRSLQELSHYDKSLGKQVRDGWRLVQREQATSNALEDVPEWVDGIERAGAHLDSLSFNVSDQVREATLEELRISAVKKFRDRASALTKAMDERSFRILNLSTDKLLPPVPIMQRGVMAMSPAETAPSFHAGESRLSITVSGDILLPEKHYSVQ